MTRSTLARRYAPLVALAVLQLLIIGFVPSKAGKSGNQQVAAANGSKAGVGRRPRVRRRVQARTARRELALAVRAALVAGAAAR